MDATKVLSCLTETWTNCLDQYYDHVASEYLKVVSEKYNISVQDLEEKTSHLKLDIMKKLTQCIPTEMSSVNKTEQVKTEESEAPKKKTTTKKESADPFAKLSRKELQEMCKERGIKTSRKNADMIAAIKEHDKETKAEADVEVEVSDPPEEVKQVHVEDDIESVADNLEEIEIRDSDCDELQEDEYYDEDLD